MWRKASWVQPSKKSDLIASVKDAPFQLLNETDRQSKKTLAVIIPRFDNFFYNNVALGAEAAAQSLGYSLVVGTTHENNQRELEIINQLVVHKVDGYIITPVRVRSTAIDLIRRIGTPLVVLVRHSNAPVFQVRQDEFGGIFTGVEYLVQNGHRKIAYIGWNTSLPSIANRTVAFLSSIDSFKIDRGEVVVKTGGNQSADGYQMAKELLREEKITAIFAGQASLARGIVRAIFEAGLTIPEDVSLLSYGDLDWLQYNSPSFSCIKLPDLEIGKKAVELLVRQIAGQTTLPEIISLPTTLIPRESVKNLS